MKYIKYILLAIIVLVILPTVGCIMIYNYRLTDYIEERYAYTEKINKTSSTGKTKVHIVGTLHNETEGVKRNDLLGLIDRIAPSVILMEADTKSCEKVLNRTDYFLQLMNFYSGKTNMERSVILKYKNKYPLIKVLPYEWEERDAFHHKHNIRSGHSEMNNAIFQLYNQGKLNKKESKIAKDFFDINNKLNAIERTGDLMDLNTASTDRIIAVRQHYSYTEMKNIVEQRPELAEFLEFSKINESYWDMRNKAMVKNILKQIQLHPGEEFVVLTGFYHRYYLLKELKKYKDQYNFEVLKKRSLTTKLLRNLWKGQ